MLQLSISADMTLTRVHLYTPPPYPWSLSADIILGQVQIVFTPFGSLQLKDFNAFSDSFNATLLLLGFSASCCGTGFSAYASSALSWPRSAIYLLSVVTLFWILTLYR